MNKVWTFVIVFLAVAILGGGIVLGFRLPGVVSGEPIEILPPQSENSSGTVYVHGAVNNPGFFTLRASDTIDSLILSAGGRSANATGLEIFVSDAKPMAESQKVDINRADVWLLDALPGIGATLAQRIIDYRVKNGPFRNTDGLLRVPGIGASVYDKIKHLVTVAER